LFVIISYIDTNFINQYAFNVIVNFSFKYNYKMCIYVNFYFYNNRDGEKQNFCM